MITKQHNHSISSFSVISVLLWNKLEIDSSYILFLLLTLMSTYGNVCIFKRNVKHWFLDTNHIVFVLLVLFMILSFLLENIVICWCLFRFYASEVVVALEYLHMMGIVYRDLKPENVLVRSDGHIMLTDFDLSLKCDSSTSAAQIVSDQDLSSPAPQMDCPVDPPPFTSTSCIIPNCMVPAVSCFQPRRKRKKKLGMHGRPEFVAEPIDVRSMSFVGTHEYLAPEIVSGEGHGSAVDWWTLGIFMFELFYGVTPFRGVGNDLTLANIVARALEFPKEPVVPAPAKDLISQLLAKDPVRRLGNTMGASAIKHHPFFQGVNWALLRCTAPPFVPPPFTREVDESCPETHMDYY